MLFKNEIRAIAYLSTNTQDVSMDILKIYFILGLAMVLVVLFDYKILPKTASRLTKPAGKDESGFALITNAIRNILMMALFAFFLWPVVVWMELRAGKKK